MAAVDRKRSLDGDTAMADGLPPRKKLRISDLPIDANKRSVIDSLLHTFKKKGEFDALRKLVYAQFDSGVSSCRMSYCAISFNAVCYRTPKPTFSRPWSSLSTARPIAIPLYSRKSAELLPLWSKEPPSGATSTRMLWTA
jgi:hypothetical protein